MRGSRAAAWVSLACVAVALRPQVFGISPLFPEIREAFDVPFGPLGLLVTVPVLAMGVASLVGPAIAGRLGVAMTATIALAVLVLAGLLRASSGDMTGLVAASVPLGLGAGLGGVLLPMLAKATIPAHRAAAATALYTAGLQLGGAIAAGVVVPVSAISGGWRPAFATLAMATLVLLAAWVVLRPRDGIEPVREELGAEIRSATGRWLPATIAAFALLILVFQGLNAWLPALLVERGWAAGEAGSLLAALVIAQVPGTLLAGAIGDRVGARRTWIMVAGVVLLVALALLAAVPAGAWAWGVVAGFAMGTMAPMILVLPLDFGADARAVGRSAGAILGLGYLAAGAGPSVMGVMRDATGSFTSGIAVLAALALALVVMGWTMPRHASRSATFP